jgi:hypothetical protein
VIPKHPQREIGLYINLVNRERRGRPCQWVTFTAEGEEKPFYEMPYPVFRRGEVDIANAIAAALDAGQRWERERGDS